MTDRRRAIVPAPANPPAAPGPPSIVLEEGQYWRLRMLATGYDLAVAQHQNIQQQVGQAAQRIQRAHAEMATYLRETLGLDPAGTYRFDDVTRRVERQA